MIQIMQGDCLDVLDMLPSETFDCVVTSPPYWGLRDYGTAEWVGGDPVCDHLAPMPGGFNSSSLHINSGLTDETIKAKVAARRQQYRDVCKSCGAQRVDRQIGLEHDLYTHISTLVNVFREVRRVLKKTGTLWLNYGDAYASSVNGRSAADTKAAGNDDRTFRDKPLNTVGPIFDPHWRSEETMRKRAQRKSNGETERNSGGVPFTGRVCATYRPDAHGSLRVGASGNKGNHGADHSGRVCAGGFLKPKDRMMLPARVAIALQEDGWWLRDEIVWHKPNPMPSSVKDRTTPAHEMIYMLSKSPKYYFDQEAILESASKNTHARRANNGKIKVPGGWDKSAGAHGTIHKGGRTKATYATRKLAQPGNGVKNNDSMDAALAIMPEKRNPRSVWTVPPRGFREAHFATFPPDLIRPCILAGAPLGGLVLDPFGGTGTVGLVCQELGRNATLIELNPISVDIAERRIRAVDIFA